MSDPYDIGFGVPPVYTGEWPPPSWADALAQHPALQPGLGVPTSTADAAMSPIPTSDMTPDAQHLAAAGGASPYSMPVGAPPMPNDQPGGLQVPSSPDAGPLPMPQMGPGAAMGQSTPQVDATSGAGEVNAPSLTQILKPQMDQRDPLAVTQADHDAAVEAESDRLANDPMALAQAQFRQQQLRENEEHIARLASDRKTIENLQAKADADAETKKQSDQVLNQAWALAHSKIDPDQWMKSRSLPQKLAAVVASVLGGLVAPQNGGRNIGLEIINKAVEENIAAQKDNLANGWKGLEMQKGAIADKRAADTAAFNNAESMRQATYQYTVNQIDDKIAALDPDSARAAKLGALKAQVLGQMAASHNAFTQQTFKNNLEIAKVRQEEIKQAEEIRKNKAAEALAWTKEGREGAAAKAAAGQVWKPEQLAVLHPGMPLPPIPMSETDYSKWIETENKGQTNAKTKHEIAVQDSGSQVRNPVTGDALPGKDGKPIILDPAQAKAANEVTEKSQNLVDALSEARRYLASDPSSFSRAEWAALETKLENAKVAYIEKHGAKASSREMQAVEEMFGPNFANMRDRIGEKGKSIARIDALIGSAKRETATALKTGAGYTGPDVLLDTSKPTASAPTSIDAATETLSDSEKRPTLASADDREYLEKGKPGSRVSIVGGKDSDFESITESPIVRHALALGIAPSKLKALDALDAMAKSGDEALRDRALDALAVQAKDGESAAIKAEASRRLQRIASTFDSPVESPDANVRDNGVR